MKAGSADEQNRLHPLLQGLPDALLRGLEDCSVQSRFASGEIICQAGRPATRILLLQEGRVSLEVDVGDGHGTEVGLLGPGDFVGCPWFGEAHKWTFTARILGDVSVQSIIAMRLQRLFEASPEHGREFALRLARGMDEQLAEARNQIARVSRLALESQVMALETFAGDAGGQED